MTLTWPCARCTGARRPTPSSLVSVLFVFGVFCRILRQAISVCRLFLYFFVGWVLGWLVGVLSFGFDELRMFGRVLACSLFECSLVVGSTLDVLFLSSLCLMEKQDYRNANCLTWYIFVDCSLMVVVVVVVSSHSSIGVTTCD